MKEYFVYIIASKKYGTLYIGVTNNICKRIWEHKHGFVNGFTKKHKVNKLVYCELHNDINQAIYREKCMKKWNRQWKIDLIEKQNPFWQDLYPTMCSEL